MKKTLAILLVLSARLGFAQQNFWENPTVFEKNMEPAHATFNLYDAEQKVSADDVSQS
ncbi:hypothetical protein I5M32_03155, partial [Pedobacter sp. SD-b]|nr:hypothetical protein [Pedobacter segetis]